MTNDGDSTLRVAVIGGADHGVVENIVRNLPEQPGITLVVAVAQAHQLEARLRDANKLPVVSINESATLERDRVYLLPDEREISLQERMIVVEAPNGRGGLDRLFRSAADAFGRHSAAVLVGGNGKDGTLGIKRIKEAGGITICQRTSDDIEGAIAANLVDLVLPPPEIGARLAMFGNEQAIREQTQPSEQVGVALRDIITMLRVRTGHDFSAYKRATLFRRLSRRMQVCQTETILDYYRFLRDYPAELRNLLRDFLISVTNFFRDPEPFDALATEVIPRLFRGKGPSDQVRVWVAGCATGEEAYSIGILLAEYAAQLQEPPQVQIFATDIDEEALAEARAGVYPELIATDVSRARLDRFFTKENDHYRANKELRDMILFSPHNVLRDPPFSRLDLISCRNLLIYLNREAQDRALSTFHFALRPEGFLFLGTSESADGATLFAPLDAKHRMFERRIAPSGLAADTLIATGRWLPTRLPSIATPGSEARPITSFGELHHRVVEQYAPPSVLINDELEIVHLSERAGKYLTLSGGEPTRQLLRLVHPGLAFELRSAIYTARQPDRFGDNRVVRFEDDGRARAVELRVRRVDLPEAGRGTLLVMFDEYDQTRDPPTTPAAEGDRQIEPLVREIEEELHRTRDQLRSTVEQYETSLEELKASNEELHAINEELRAATEELETSKEELQSVNEELTTVNHELKLKIDEVSRAHSDVQNLMTSTDIGVLFLDRELNIKRFTPRTRDVFNIIASDLGRPLSHLTHVLDFPDLSKIARQVLDHLRTVDREVTATNGRRYLARVRPYRSIEDRIDGVVLTFVDISDLKRAEEARLRSEAALHVVEERLALALRVAPLAVITHDESLSTTWVFVRGKQSGDGLPALDKIFAPGHSERYLAIASEVLATGNGQRAELDVVVDGERRIYDFRLEPKRSQEVGIIAVGFDITPSKLAEASLLESDRRKDEFLATVSHELRNPLTPLRVAFDVVRVTKDPEKIRQALDIMDRQLQIVVRLVDDLLDISRFTRGKINLTTEAIDPAQIVHTALEAARPFADAGGQELRVELPPSDCRIDGDFIRLTQVLVNLLTNAIRYTPSGGRIDLSVTVDKPRRVLVMRVRDSGMGIPQELLPRIFDIFVQADDGHGGLGVGLSLARRIVELHRGTIHVASEGRNKGSTFTVELPLREG